MAQTAILGEPITWVSSGVSDTLECYTYNLNHFGGYQLDVDGFDAEDATITVYTRSGAAKILGLDGTPGEVGLFGDGAAIARIVISGIAAGSYPLTISKAF